MPRSKPFTMGGIEKDVKRTFVSMGAMSPE